MLGDRERAQRHLIPHFTRGDAWRADDLVVIDRGEGCYVWDADGNQYLDALAGLFCTNLGHGRSDLTAAAAKQMDKLAFHSNWGFAHPASIEAASMIAAVAPGDLDRVFFVNSGSEAVESALKFARCYHLANGEEQRHKVIARNWAYHGTSLGALALTGIPNLRDPFLPMLAGPVRHVPNTLGCQLEPGQSAADLSCVTAIEEAIVAEGPETVAMVIAEPVQGVGGVFVPPDDYFPRVRAICDQYDVLLIADEVICGFGRTGEMFALNRYDIEPDILAFAKGITSGYLPLGGIQINDRILDAMNSAPQDEAWLHGFTYSGHAASCAVGLRNLAILEDEKLAERSAEMGERLRSGLSKLSEFGNVGDVRGLGLLCAVEFIKDQETKEPDNELAMSLQNATAARGVRTRALNGSLAFSPPLVISEDEVDQIVDAIGAALDSMSEQ